MIFIVIIISFSQLITKIIGLSIVCKQIKPIEFHDYLQNKTSIYSQVCNKLKDSLEFFGTHGMDAYQSCEGKYDLLGNDNSLIKKDSPKCFTNLNDFYCKFHIKHTNREKYNHSQMSESLQQTLTNILVCNNNGHNNNSSCLNNLTHKIENAYSFCDNNIIPDKKASIFYVRLREDCKQSVELYNICIDSENVLFPNSNYSRCFDTRNAIYTSSEIDYLNDKEKYLCSNFILPSIAWRKSQFEQIKCKELEQKTFLKYDLLIKVCTLKS